MEGLSYHFLRCTPFSFSGLYLQKIASFFKNWRYLDGIDLYCPLGLHSVQTKKKKILTVLLKM